VADPACPDRAVLGGIVFMLRTGLPWRLLPARELGAGSPVTCWRRLRDWQAAGMWQQLHAALLNDSAVRRDRLVARLPGFLERPRQTGEAS
jgi:transposase